ncbi:signal peptidase II [Streptomyces megasporus]|uniref:signal peptidase II n=1 Tax=Streptomyces megasporus TaxID=44060 RepID=UPI000690A652|nr:signal peptidase II [Streptomyces megasporus]
MTPGRTAARPAAPAAGRAAARRLWLLLTAGVLAGIDLGLKAWAERALADAPIEAWPLDLRLAFNPGMAFSFAADAPAGAVIAVTGAITTAVAAVLWRTAPAARRLWGASLAAVLGGAMANLIDRAADGVVTDYLHTGWWPTFNLADVFIVCGGLLLVALSWQADRTSVDADDQGYSPPTGSATVPSVDAGEGR